jgi:DNA repair photolyase
LPHPEFVLRRGPYVDRPEISSVELIRGCAHRCAFCPQRAAPEHPGDDAIYLYEGLAQRLAIELAARSEKPRAVIVGPSTDPFQPIPEIIAETLAIIRLLARHGVESWLTTRGVVPPGAIDELAELRDHVRMTVALASADPTIHNSIEPGAASIDDRLHLITQLRFNEIPVEVSFDPLLPNVTDSKDQLQALLELLAERGVSRISTSYLVLRPGVREQIERQCADQSWLELLFSAYDDGPMLRDGNQVSQFLLKSKRQRGYALLMSLAANFGIAVRVNRLDNPDFQPAGPLARSSPRATSLQQRFRQSIRPDAIGA